MPAPALRPTTAPLPVIRLPVGQSACDFKPAARPLTRPPWLDGFRRTGLSSRLSPRAALEYGSAASGSETCCVAFLRAVAAGLGRPVKLHRPGATELSFDEAWIVRLIEAIRAADGDTVVFAIGSRIPAAGRRMVHRLAGSVAERVERRASAAHPRKSARPAHPAAS
ncbi:MAG: hypothetical protein ACFBSD_08260 [Paracoccaceae bacterium]